MSIKAGVVLASKFCFSGEVFTNYINYIDRDEATRNANLHKFSLYNDYMADSEKTYGLFTADKDILSNEEKENLKKVFEQAENNGSVMWQHVISFDNKWLEQQGIYNSSVNSVNEIKLRELTRLAMMRLESKEGLNNAIWSASIHFNTDNIHIHIAQVEPVPMHLTKDKQVARGKIKLSSLESAKSAIVNNLLENQPENEMINNIIRKNIVEVKRQDNMVNDKEFTNMFLNILHQLPANKQYWNYRSKQIQSIIPQIDKLSKWYLDKYHAEDLKKLDELLKKQDDKYKIAYGVGKQGNRSYYDYKMKDLYYRLGNAMLKQMRDYDKEQKRIIYEFAKQNREKISQKQFINYQHNVNFKNQQNMLKISINLTKMFMKDKLQEFKDELSYEIMQREIELKNKQEEFEY